VAATVFMKRPFWVAVIGAVLVAGTFSTSPGRRLAQRWLNSLRLQKVQAVSLDFSPFVDPNAFDSVKRQRYGVVDEEPLETEWFMES
jgi:hypothetical protein